MRAMTDAELLLLWLVPEMTRHGYEIDQVIDQRGMRQWTQIGFSSIYFVLGRLQKLRLVTARKAARATASPRARKVYAVTNAGRRALVAHTLAALRDIQPAYS